MKVMSWNILTYLNKGQDMVKKVENIINEIVKINPDILLLQEVSDYFTEQLTIKTSYKFLIKTINHAGFCSLFLRDDLNNENIIVKKHYDTGVSIQIDDITIANCHLAPYRQNQEFRFSQLKDIVDRTTTPNIILMGDMNMGRDQSFNYKNFEDIAIQFNNTEDTWFASYFNSYSTHKNRYDRVFSNMKIKEYNVYQEYKHLSDHIPISIEI